MKKLLFLATVAIAAVFTSCSFDDGDIWDELNGQHDRLTQLEQKVESLNSDITSIQTIVAAIQSKDMITSVTPLSDGSGYVINFVTSPSITIKNGVKGADGTNGTNGTNGTDGKTPAISVAEEGGVYYWTVDGVFMQDGSGNKLPVTGNDGENGTNGQDAIAPQLSINPTTFEWEISTDGGLTWTSTGIVAKGQDGAQGNAGSDGDTLFDTIDTDTSPDYVVFTLTDGREFIVQRYLVLTLSFEGIEFDAFEIVAGDPATELAYSNTGTIAKIGIASAIPTGWSVRVDANNKILVSSSIPGEIDVLIVATSPDGTSASYWVTISALANAPVPAGSITELELAITNALPGDIINVQPGGDYSTTTPIVINKNITIRSTDPAGTVFTTDATHPVFVIDNTAATIEGLTISTGDADATGGNLALISLINNTTGSVIKNCTFEGSYDLASGTDNQVVRGILAYASYPLSIIGNTFRNVRQPAYIECAAIIKDNYTEGTRGWVICLNHNVTMTGNTFGTNAVDIAIIMNGPAPDALYYDDARMWQLHNENGNAHINNQIEVGSVKSYISIKKDGSTY